MQAKSNDVSTCWTSSKERTTPDLVISMGLSVNTFNRQCKVIKGETKRPHTASNLSGPSGCGNTYVISLVSLLLENCCCHTFNISKRHGDNNNTFSVHGLFVQMK